MMRGFERLARVCLRVARRSHQQLPKRVLVLGDSHVRVFEHPWFAAALPFVHFDVEYVPGATAIGIVNRDSVTTALVRFTKALATRQHEWVLLNLGEVDTAYSLWRLVEFRGVPVADLLSEAVSNYCDFIGKVAADHRIAILSAPLPTLSDQASPQNETAAVRQQVAATRKERTELAFAFNGCVKSFCDGLGIPFLDSSAEALGADGFVKQSWCRRFGYDHHYARWPYARCLARQLRALFVEMAGGSSAQNAASMHREAT